MTQQSQQLLAEITDERTDPSTLLHSDHSGLSSDTAEAFSAISRSENPVAELKAQLDRLHPRLSLK